MAKEGFANDLVDIWWTITEKSLYKEWTEESLARQFDDFYLINYYVFTTAYLLIAMYFLLNHQIIFVDIVKFQLILMLRFGEGISETLHLYQYLPFYANAGDF